MISTWSQSALYSLTVVEHSFPRLPKSALKIEGAMMAGGAIMTCSAVQIGAGHDSGLVARGRESRKRSDGGLRCQSVGRLVNGSQAGSEAVYSCTFEHRERCDEVKSRNAFIALANQLRNSAPLWAASSRSPSLIPSFLLFSRPQWTRHILSTSINYSTIIIPCLFISSRCTAVEARRRMSPRCCNAGTPSDWCHCKRSHRFVHTSHPPIHVLYLCSRAVRIGTNALRPAARQSRPVTGEACVCSSFGCNIASTLKPDPDRSHANRPVRNTAGASRLLQSRPV